MGRILNQAIYLSWPPGTPKSKFAYKGGHPTPQFKAALNAVFPKRGKWSKAARKGASCDVAVAVVARSSGVAKKFPRGRSEQRHYKGKTAFTRIVKKNATPIKHARTGDIVLYDRTKGGKKGHIFIFGGDCIYEASNKKKYFHRNGSLKKMQKKYKKIIILREK